MIKNIAVYCGSSQGNKKIYAEKAYELGKLLAENNIGLVYGGGNIGLMGIIADSVLENGGEVIGVIPDLLTGKEIAHEGLTELIVVKDMSERKNLMAEMSDAFIAMPGGFGTFDEILEVLTYYQLGISKNPVGFLNVDEYYNPLMQLFDNALDSQFMKPQHRYNMVVEEEPHSLLDKIINFNPESIEENWIAKLKENNKY